MAIWLTYSFYLNCSCFPITGHCAPLISLEKLRPLQFNYLKAFSEIVAQKYSAKKVFLKNVQNSQQNKCAGVSFLIKSQVEACNFAKKNTLAKVFSCAFCEVFKNVAFHGTPLVAVSVFWATHFDLRTSGDTENLSS